jgi:hypothetical protein
MADAGRLQLRDDMADLDISSAAMVSAHSTSSVSENCRQFDEDSPVGALSGPNAGSSAGPAGLPRLVVSSVGPMRTRRGGAVGSQRGKTAERERVDIEAFIFIDGLAALAARFMVGPSGSQASV